MHPNESIIIGQTKCMCRKYSNYACSWISGWKSKTCPEIPENIMTSFSGGCLPEGSIASWRFQCPKPMFSLALPCPNAERLHFITFIYFIRRTQLQSYHPFFKLFLLPHSESMWAHLRHHRHFEKVIPPHEAIAMTKITSTSNPPKSGRISMNLWVCFGGGSSANNRVPTYCQQFMNNTSNL